MCCSILASGVLPSFPQVIRFVASRAKVQQSGLHCKNQYCSGANNNVHAKVRADAAAATKTHPRSSDVQPLSASNHEENSLRRRREVFPTRLPTTMVEDISLLSKRNADYPSPKAYPNQRRIESSQARRTHSALEKVCTCADISQVPTSVRHRFLSGDVLSMGVPWCCEPCKRPRGSGESSLV